MITVDPASRRHREVTNRVELVAEDLGRLAARTLGGRLPKTRIVITDGPGMIRTFQRAENQLAGAGASWRKAKEAAWDWAFHRHNAGCTVYDRNSILVVINAAAHRRYMDQVDKTVIHELTHAVQLSAPGVRRDHTRYQRMRLGVEPHDDKFLTTYTRAMDTRETQARNLESLIK